MEEVVLFSYVAYFLWRQRHAWVHERVACNPVAVVQRASVLLRDYKSSCPVGGRSHLVVPRRPDLVAAKPKWDPPPEGVFKVIWDFFVDSISKRMSVGIIIQDHDGYVLAAKCLNAPILSSDVQPKVFAYLSALFFASEIGFYDVELEGPPVVFLLDLHVEVLGTFSVSNVSREANKGAVVLAKLGSSVKQAKIWLEEVCVDL
ncbi:dicer-like protein 4 [Fagus crenata]